MHQRLSDIGETQDVEILWAIESGSRAWGFASPLDRFLSELEISRATFKRDLEYLRDRFDAPIVWDADARGYRYDGVTDSALPGFWLSPAELHALMSIVHLLETLGPGLLSESLAPLRGRIERTLGETPKKLRELRHRVKLLQMAGRPVAAPHFFCRRQRSAATQATQAGLRRTRTRGPDGARAFSATPCLLP